MGNGSTRANTHRVNSHPQNSHPLKLPPGKFPLANSKLVNFHPVNVNQQSPFDCTDRYRMRITGFCTQTQDTGSSTLRAVQNLFEKFKLPQQIRIVLTVYDKLCICVLQSKLVEKLTQYDPAITSMSNQRCFSVVDQR